MQAIEKDGTERPLEPYDHEKLIQHLEKPEVQEVRVFKLKEGMTLHIGGKLYKVSRVRQNGKVTLKPK
jgi:hypothetical protein